MLKLIIDTDTASDDAVALLMALRSREARVDAVTVVAGNVEFEQEVRNALYVVERFSRGRVPVYPGCRRPLVKTWRYAHEVHGRDGMGNSQLPQPSIQPENKHAAQAIVELANSSPGEYTLIALGPLTNIALALRLDEELPKKIRQLYIMGGSPTCLGNVTPTAEYNFWVDPEAAHIVLQSGFKPVIVGWDVVVRHGGRYEEEVNAVGGWKTEAAEFFAKITRQLLSFTKTQGFPGIYLPDPLTMAAALNPEIITRREEMLMVIDRSDTIMRGTSVVMKHREPNTIICREANSILFKQMLYEALRQG